MFVRLRQSWENRAKSGGVAADSGLGGWLVERRRLTQGGDRSPFAVDLFSGCGGLTQGLKQAGFEVAGAVEIDPLAVETYEANHTGVCVWPSDIRDLSVSEVKRRLGIRKGQLDLLAGCPPCEGFSSMRTLNGSKKVEDDRNDLIFEFLRFVEGLRPKAVMMENVPALAKDERLKRFCERLDALGYWYRCDVLNVADFGVPQRRRRMVLLAGLRGPIEFAQADSRRGSVRRAISGLPRAGESGDPLHDLPEKRSPKVLDLIRSVPKDGGSRRDLGPDRQLACHARSDGFKDVYGRMKWADVAPTITGGCVNPSKGRFLHPEEDRSITLREAALLQSFPHGYRFSLRRGKMPAAELIGNALPPEFVRRHGEQVASHLSKHRRRVS